MILIRDFIIMETSIAILLDTAIGNTEKAGLELEYNNTLLNISESTALNELKNIVLPNTEGNTLKLTIDHHLQEYSRNLLKGHKGLLLL